MQQLHGDSERKPVTMRESKRHVATQWDSERHAANTGRQ